MKYKNCTIQWNTFEHSQISPKESMIEYPNSQQNRREWIIKVIIRLWYSVSLFIQPVVVFWYTKLIYRCIKTTRSSSLIESKLNLNCKYERRTHMYQDSTIEIPYPMNEDDYNKSLVELLDAVMRQLATPYDLRSLLIILHCWDIA